MIKLTLPPVKASGRREGWWFHVKGMAEKPRPGLRQFEGERLAAGECELPLMSVILLIRPVGAAKSDDRVADVMFVDAATSTLKGLAYGLPWGSKAGDPELRESVLRALASRNSYNDTVQRIRAATDHLIGKRNTASERLSLTAEVTKIVRQAVPPAEEIMVTPEPSGNGLSVTFRIAADRQSRSVRCAVPGYGPDGDPDFFFLCVDVPKDYVDLEEDMESDALHHHAAARKAAIAEGYDGITDGTPVYDDMSGRWSGILDMFEWSTALVYNLKGDAI